MNENKLQGSLASICKTNPLGFHGIINEWNYKTGFFF